MSTAQQPLLSIGALSDATGVPVETLRMWERRYGHPVSMRLPSGHRRYSQEQIRAVRRVAEAVSRGFRPSKVMRAAPEEIDVMIRDDVEVPRPVAESWTEAARTMDAAAFRARLDQELAIRSPVAFVTDVVGPMLTAVGRAWVDGTLGVRHEHFVAHVVSDLLRELRTRAPHDPTGPRIVFATLPDERHALGIEMAATVAAVAGARCTVLGPDAPVDQIAATAVEIRAVAVAISVSVAHGGTASDRAVKELRALLPTDRRLIVGGNGSRRTRRSVRGIEYQRDFVSFDRFVRELRAGAVPSAGTKTRAR